MMRQRVAKKRNLGGRPPFPEPIAVTSLMIPIRLRDAIDAIALRRDLTYSETLRLAIEQFVTADSARQARRARA